MGVFSFSVLCTFARACLTYSHLDTQPLKDLVAEIQKGTLLAEASRLEQVLICMIEYLPFCVEQELEAECYEEVT